MYRRNSASLPPLPKVVTVASFLETARKLGKMNLVEVMEEDAEFAQEAIAQFQALLNRRWEKKHGMSLEEARRLHAAPTVDAAPTTEKGAWTLFANSVDEIYPDYPDLVPALKKLALEQAARA